MTDETRQARLRMLAKHIEAERDRAAAAPAPFIPVAETPDTVTLRRSDYEALIRKAFSK